MWFGTGDGLNKFDGYKFTAYKHDLSDSTTLSHNDVRCIYEDVSGQLWIATLGGGINMFDRESEIFVRYTSESNNKTNLKSNYIRKFAGFLYDYKETLWIGTSKGLDKFDPVSKQFTHFLHTDKGYPYSYIEPVVVDSTGKVWFGCRLGGLYRFDPETEQFYSFSDDPDSPHILSDNRIYSLFWDESGILWIGTTGAGLLSYDPRNNKFTSYQMDPGDRQTLNSTWVSSIYEDRSGKLWLGTPSGGINILDRRTGKFTSYMHDPADANSISDNTVMCTFEDQAGVIWVGTWDGINKIDPRKTQFMNIKPHPGDSNSLSGSFIWSICKSNYQGRPALWIGTKTDGLNKLDLASGQIERFMHDPGNPNSIPSNFILSLCEDRSGILWIGTYGEGLIKYNQQSKRFFHYQHDPADPGSIHGTIIRTIFEDSSGNLWIGTRNSGLNLLDRTTNQFKRILRNLHITDIYEDKSGDIWIATPHGLKVLKHTTGQITSYRHNPEDSSSISNNEIAFIHESQKIDRPVLWIGASGGLIRFDPESEIFKTYTIEDGLPDNTINTILEDNIGNLWLGTKNGLSKLNLQTETFSNYDVSDGLLDNTFTGTACKTADGQMFFSTTKGVVAFYPDSLTNNHHIPEIVITDFQIFNQPVEIRSNKSNADNDHYFLDKHISELQEIKLSYRESVFSFGFAALDYAAPEKNRYAYRMEGVDPNWVYTDDSRRFATYTNLDAGEYTFRVKGSNNDGVWNEAGTALKIVITPPWWKTNLAYAFYLLLFISVVFTTWRIQLRRIRLKQQLKMEHFEAEKLREVDQLKSRFFANISHEFRTPLTLIEGPARQIMDGSFTGTLKQQCQMILRNSHRLLGLINQILDLSKLESGEIQLQVTKIDIIQYLKGLVLTFSPLADRKKVMLTFTSEEDFLTGYVDRDKLEKIVTNLISNAFKFTPEGGEIFITLKAPNSKYQMSNKSPIPNSQFPANNTNLVEIEISNTGPGIPNNQLDKIFDRFYQAENNYKKDGEGTGIGLALTKELVELCHGEISVNSTPNIKTTFTVNLPITRQYFSEDELVVSQPADGIQEPGTRIQDPESRNGHRTGVYDHTPSDNMAPMILLVEDNPDVTAYISGFMANDYRIITAEDGKDGLKKAMDKYPDLIISDVMMPLMDGFEFCEKVKSDERTSHIPVILLTAKADLDSKIRGLEYGADDYVTKPFEARELQIRTRNLIEQRRKLREKFSALVDLNPADIAASSMDEQLLKRLLEVFEDHMEEPDFSIEQFARHIGMSRIHLNRKIQALTNLSTRDFIRTLRLQRAARLLEQASGTVSEIAYKVGFNNLSYFSRTFRKHFGKLPRDFAKK
jgi:signal transduction histidine kinase/ligand-binding sensor domain-containing protein/DNA-binding response OmpR family regulator